MHASKQLVNSENWFLELILIFNFHIILTMPENALLLFIIII